MEFNEKKEDELIDELDSEDEEEEETGSMKQWLQENLRIMISVLIVVVIAAGIYSYSNRSIAPTASEENSTEQSEEIASSESTTEKNKTETASKETTTEKKVATETRKKETQTTTSAATSQETEKSFVETAGKGDGTTKMARRALANYLEKNPDSTLTPEHKIYIEDYLRKNISHKGKVNVGASVEFSKDLIQQAIGKSKGLNEAQLKNLHKYAVRVPSLT